MNIGIIGYGGMGRAHQENIPSDEDFHVTAVYDINPQKVDAAKAKGFTPYYTLEDFLADKSIDLAVIATPNNFHRELAVAALRAGKHVVCEKPAAMSCAELREMTDTAKECGRVFTVHQNRRWDTDFRIVKKAVDENVIGTPFYIESRVQGANGVPGDWRCVKEAGGGMLLDWGVHLIDQMMYMIKSPVTEVYAHLLSVKFPGVDDNLKVMLKFKNGLSALVEVDTYCFIPLPRWHVTGDAGTLVVNGWDCTGEVKRANRVKMNYEPGIVYTASGPTRTMAPRPVETVETLPLPQPPEQSNWREFYRNVGNVIADAVEDTAELAVKPAEVMRVLRVIEAAFESSEKGVCVRGEF